MTLNVTIHAKTNVWQKRYREFFINGLKRHNINARVSNSDQWLAGTDIAILFGPHSWKTLELSNQPFLMVNRKFLGFGAQDPHDIVTISWGGFNGNGIFCADDIDKSRFEHFIKPNEFIEWADPGEYYLLCEQSDVGRCKKYPSIQNWYTKVKENNGNFKTRKKINPERGNVRTFRTDFFQDIKNVKAAVVLNSTVSIEMLLAGVPVISMDIGDPSYAINSHTINDIVYPDRLQFFQYLAHCQWHYTEIENGDFWTQLYPKRGKKLNEYNK